METNWIQFLDSFFKNMNLKFEKIIENSNPFISYFNDSIYLDFEFQNSNYLNKVEIGKNNNNLRSNYKIIFSLQKPNNILFKQNCFEIDSHISYELEFNKANKELLIEFLKNLVEKGWTEKIYKYGDEQYKCEIVISNHTYRILLKSDLEQDFPYLLNPYYRKIKCFWFDLNLISKKKITESKI